MRTWHSYLWIVAASEGHGGNRLHFSSFWLEDSKLEPEFSSWTVTRHQMRLEGNRKGEWESSYLQSNQWVKTKWRTSLGTCVWALSTFPCSPVERPLTFPNAEGTVGEGEKHHVSISESPTLGMLSSSAHFLPCLRSLSLLILLDFNNSV